MWFVGGGWGRRGLGVGENGMDKRKSRFRVVVGLWTKERGREYFFSKMGKFEEMVRGGDDCWVKRDKRKKGLEFYEVYGSQRTIFSKMKT